MQDNNKTNPQTGSQAEFKAAPLQGLPDNTIEKPVPQAGPQAESTAAPPQGLPGNTSEKPEFKAAPLQGPPNNTPEAPQFKAALPSGQAGPLNNTPEKPEFRAAVGMSRKLDAREAGREVARDTLEKLGKDPDFFLLFTTIHYEKHGGFQELLNGVWDVLPKGTPLIGGTVAGFINPQGCWTRGATALAVNYPNMDIATGIGHNTKRNPQKAATECAQQIKEKLKNSKYENGLLVDLISSGLVPEIPWIGRKVIFKNRLFGESLVKLLDISEKIFQKGVCKQEDILEILVKSFPSFKLIHGGSTDDIKQLKNYQFYEGYAFSNSVCVLVIKTDLQFSVNTTHGLTDTGNKFTIDELKHNNRVISKINQKPAVPELFRLLGLSNSDLNEHIFKKIFYLPIGYKSLSGKLVPSVVGIFLGDSFLVIFKVGSKEGTLLHLSGTGLLKAIDEAFSGIPSRNIKLGLISSCASRLVALGDHSYVEQKRLLQIFQEKPFLLYYVAGEGTFSPEKGLNYGNYTFNVAIFE